jgi:hypothetical protein
MGLTMVMICDGCKVQVSPDDKTYTVHIRHNAERVQSGQTDQQQNTNFSLCDACAKLVGLAGLHARFLRK